MSNRRLERDIFGGSDSELSSEDEGIEEREEVPERRRPSPEPQKEREPAESSGGESEDDYVQEKAPVKKVKRRRRREDNGEPRTTQRKRKRRSAPEPPPEIDFESMAPEQARKLQMQMKVDAIAKAKKSNRPKKRAAGGEEDALDRFADEEVSKLREEMLKAAAEDDDANKDKLPATAKLKLLPRVKEVLQKSSLAQSILDNNLLDGVRRWLEPLPDRSLPVLNIQMFFFEQLTKMFIDTNSLKDSGLGRIVLFYTKCKRVTTSIQRLANDLISAWSRPIIKRSASYRDRQMPVAAEPGEGGSQRPVEKLNSILARAKESERDRVRKNHVMMPKADFGVMQYAPRAGAGVKMSASVQNDIERRKNNAERIRTLTRKVATTKN